MLDLATGDKLTCWLRDPSTDFTESEQSKILRTSRALGGDGLGKSDTVTRLADRIADRHRYRWGTSVGGDVPFVARPAIVALGMACIALGILQLIRRGPRRPAPQHWPPADSPSPPDPPRPSPSR